MILVENPTCIWRPRWGCTLRNFAKIFGIRKLASLGYPLSYDVSCMVLGLAFWYNTGVWRTNRRTDRQTHDDSIYRARRAVMTGKCQLSLQSACSIITNKRRNLQMKNATLEVHEECRIRVLPISPLQHSPCFLHSCNKSTINITACMVVSCF